MQQTNQLIDHPGTQAPTLTPVKLPSTRCTSRPGLLTCPGQGSPVPAAPPPLPAAGRVHAAPGQPAVPPLQAPGPAPPAPAPNPLSGATLSDVKDSALTLSASLLGGPTGLKNIISYAAVAAAAADGLGPEGAGPRQGGPGQDRRRQPRLATPERHAPRRPPSCRPFIRRPRTSLRGGGGQHLSCHRDGVARASPSATVAPRPGPPQPPRGPPPPPYRSWLGVVVRRPEHTPPRHSGRGYWHAGK